jgi:hypothetical protein
MEIIVPPTKYLKAITTFIFIGILNKIKNFFLIYKNNIKRLKKMI